MMKFFGITEEEINKELRKWKHYIYIMEKIVIFAIN
jgi:hypothetical protein